MLFRSNDTATTEIYTLSLHDALPISRKSLMAAIDSKGATFANSALVPLGYSKTSHVGLTGYWVGEYSITGDLEPINKTYVTYTTDSGAGAVVKSTYKRPAMPAKGLPN